MCPSQPGYKRAGCLQRKCASVAWLLCSNLHLEGAKDFKAEAQGWAPALPHVTQPGGARARPEVPVALWAVTLQTASRSRLLFRICPTTCVISHCPSSLSPFLLLLLFVPNACSGASACLQNGVHPSPSSTPSAPAEHEIMNFLSYHLVLHRQKPSGAATRGCSHALLRAGCCQGCTARAQLLLKTWLKDFPPALLRARL